MGKNLDTDNIFGSYMNSVLLKEYVKPTESTEPAAPLTPEERAYANDSKVRGKTLTDSQARLMFAKRNEAETQPNAQVATQPATNAPSRGKLTVNSTANDIKNASVEDIINLINSL